MHAQAQAGEYIPFLCADLNSEARFTTAISGLDVYYPRENCERNVDNVRVHGRACM